MADIVCVGIMVADALGRPIDDVPEKGRLQLFDHMELHTGGCAVNTATAVARMGLSSAVIGKVGRDGFGDFLVNELKSEGVDASAVARDDSASTSFTFIMIASDGERRFLHTFGANATFCLDDVDMRVARSAKILHVAGTFLMPTFDGEQTAEVLRQAQAAGVTTTLDTAFNDRLDNCLSIIRPCLPHIDYFLPSIEEVIKLSGTDDYRKAARMFKDLGCKNVAIKLGREGSFILTDDGGVHVPIYKVETVDASGAGDSFIAGFLAGILQGWDMVECARFGSAVAAHCVQAIGCTVGVKSFDEIRAFQAGREA